jgi:hypothetical protein
MDCSMIAIVFDLATVFHVEWPLCLCFYFGALSRHNALIAILIAIIFLMWFNTL